MPGPTTLSFEIQPTSPRSPTISPRVPPKPVQRGPSFQNGLQSIDDSRPGGVRTLKGKYEKKTTGASVSPSLVNGDAKVKFNEEVKHIPRSDNRQSYLSSSPSPPPHTGRQSPTGADASESFNSSIPNAPPPPPLPKIDFRDSDEPFTIRGKDGRARPVRVGKIQWPPPQQEEERKTISVGKLQIDEKKAAAAQAQPMKTKADVHRRTMEIIRSQSQDVTEEAPKPKPKKWEPPKKTVHTPVNVSDYNIYYFVRSTKISVIQSDIQALPRIDFGALMYRDFQPASVWNRTPYGQISGTLAKWL